MLRRVGPDWDSVEGSGGWCPFRSSKPKRATEDALGLGFQEAANPIPTRPQGPTQVGRARQGADVLCGRKIGTAGV